MRDPAKLRAFELAAEVAVLVYRMIAEDILDILAFSLRSNSTGVTI